MQYTIISATNRRDSNTLKIAEAYRDLLLERGIRANLLTLEGLDVLDRNPALEAVEEEFLVPADKFIFVTPEYNGSFPGILKALIDNTDIHRAWPGKKALLVGVSTGRAGNLRGMDHLTGILHYLKVSVHHNKLPISVVNKLLDADGKLIDQATLNVINQQLDEFVVF